MSSTEDNDPTGMGWNLPRPPDSGRLLPGSTMLPLPNMPKTPNISSFPGKSRLNWLLEVTKTTHSVTLSMGRGISIIYGTVFPPAKAARNFEGEVQAFQEKLQEYRPKKGRGPWIVWNFRVMRYDTKGNPLPPIPVEMISLYFEGAIRDGDQVRVPYAWRARKTVKAKKIFNLITQSKVIVKENYLNLAGVIVPVVVWIVFVLFLVIVLSHHS